MDYPRKNKRLKTDRKTMKISYELEPMLQSAYTLSFLTVIKSYLLR